MRTAGQPAFAREDLKSCGLPGNLFTPCHKLHGQVIRRHRCIRRNSLEIGHVPQLFWIERNSGFREAVVRAALLLPLRAALQEVRYSSVTNGPSAPALKP